MGRLRNVVKKINMGKIRIGEYRLIPKGTVFWSINCQTELITRKDEIVEINQRCTGELDIIFVLPKQLIFNAPGFMPTLIGKGVDEWMLNYSETLPYTIPKAQPLKTFNYSTLKRHEKNHTKNH